MPKAGFKSITISESVYKKFHDAYQNKKDELAMKGINSFAGYVTCMLEETMQKDSTFARHAPKLKRISSYDNKIVLQDDLRDRVAEVAVQGGELYCMLCEEKRCVHISFVWSLPDVYEILRTKGKRNPR